VPRALLSSRLLMRVGWGQEILHLDKCLHLSLFRALTRSRPTGSTSSKESREDHRIEMSKQGYAMNEMASVQFDRNADRQCQLSHGGI
jgi:hypothetical protein